MLAAMHRAKLLANLIVDKKAKPFHFDTLDIEQKDEIGCTPLWAAAFVGNLDQVNVLIKNGASINRTTTNSKETALHIACIENHPEIVAALVDAGAREEVFTTEGHSAMHFAAGGPEEIRKETERRHFYDAQWQVANALAIGIKQVTGEDGPGWKEQIEAAKPKPYKYPEINMFDERSKSARVLVEKGWDLWLFNPKSGLIPVWYLFGPSLKAYGKQIRWTSIREIMLLCRSCDRLRGTRIGLELGVIVDCLGIEGIARTVAEFLVDTTVLMRMKKGRVGKIDMDFQGGGGDRADDSESDEEESDEEEVESEFEEEIDISLDDSLVFFDAHENAIE